MDTCLCVNSTTDTLYNRNQHNVVNQLYSNKRCNWFFFYRSTSLKRNELSLPLIEMNYLLLWRFSSVQLLSCVWLFATPWIAARQASLSIKIPGVCSNACPSSRWCTEVANAVLEWVNFQKSELYCLLGTSSARGSTFREHLRSHPPTQAHTHTQENLQGDSRGFCLSQPSPQGCDHMSDDSSFRQRLFQAGQVTGLLPSALGLGSPGKSG